MEETQFAGQDKDEDIILVLKQHSWYYFIPLIKILGLCFILAIVFYFFQASWPTSYSLFVVIVWVIYIAAKAWFCWANTIYLLTNRRIIIVIQKGWFHRAISEATLGNILFISHKVEGPVQTLLNFGSIHIRTSGVIEEEIVLANIYDPYDVQQKIVEAQKKISGREATKKSETESKDFWKKK